MLLNKVLNKSKFGNHRFILNFSPPHPHTQVWLHTLCSTATIWLAEAGKVEFLSFSGGNNASETDGKPAIQSSNAKHQCTQRMLMASPTWSYLFFQLCECVLGLFNKVVRKDNCTCHNFSNICLLLVLRNISHYAMNRWKSNLNFLKKTDCSFCFQICFLAPACKKSKSIIAFAKSQFPPSFEMSKCAGV